jgi:feruloyl esterase
MKRAVVVLSALMLLLLLAVLGMPAFAQTATPAAPTPTPAPKTPAELACEKLKDLKLPATTITEVEFVMKRPVEEKFGIVVYGPDWKSPKSAFGQASVGVPFCRVAATVEPAIKFEVWMPPTDKWNGKFFGVGNGALAGGINYPAMVAPLMRGYAVASTDGGHESPAPVVGDWMNGRPDLWDDFGYRAIHEMTKKSKLIVEAYYGKAPAHSYFQGCSGGGQQALAEAQRYPADYDGIIAGAPANFPTRMWPGEVWPAFVTHRSKAYEIPLEKLPLIHEAAVKACDALDGEQDGLIEDPRQCKFDPAVLQCKGADAKDCLTAQQVDSVKKIYDGLRDPTTGELFWPGYEPGSELDWPGHIGEPFVIPLSYFKYMVFNNPDWDWKTFDFTDPKDFAILYDADARYGPILNATDPDLTAFRLLGGKLILWHGWADQNIAPRNTINYYNSVVEDVGSEAEAQKFVRLFMIPGVGHCRGGEGPDTFDMVSALEQWVEKGVAPDMVIATKIKDGKPAFSRPLCPYPQTIEYKGSGSMNDAANFVCGKPK